MKRAAVLGGGSYPDLGCNFQVFTNPQFLELETLGLVVELQPEQAVEHEERWWLFANVPTGEGDGWIESSIVPLVKQTAL